MTVAENWDDRNCTADEVILAIFLNMDSPTISAFVCL